MKNITLDKSYMQSPKFWCKPHNKKMYALTEKLMTQRDLIEDFANEHPNDYVQITNGTLKKIPKKGFFSFLKGPSIYTEKFAEYLNSDYRMLASEIHANAKQIRHMFHK